MQEAEVERLASEKKRLLEEVEILGTLDHPQIMRLHRVFGDTEAGYQDEIVLILEYLSGENISTCFGLILAFQEEICIAGL